MTSNRHTNRLKFLFSKSFNARLRVIWLSWRFKLSSSEAYIFKPLKLTPRFVKWEKNVVVLDNARLEGVSRYGTQVYNPLIELGENVTIQQGCHITCAESIKIGKNTALAAYVTVTDIDHRYIDPDIPIERQDLKVQPVSIGEDCKIYNNAVILQGTVIGKHCVVGANSVVKGAFPDYSIIVGVPARIVKRYNHMTQKWEKLQN